MAPFATAAELAELLGETFDATRTTQANAALEAATAAIQGWCRQRLDYVENDTVTIRGVFDDELVLPERPAITVVAVVYDGTALVADTDFTVFGSSLWRAGGWGGPDIVVDVTYHHGYDPIPDVVRAVCLQLGARLMASPQSVASESIGSYSVTYNGGGEIFAMDEFAPLLSRYRQRAASIRIGR